MELFGACKLQLVRVDWTFLTLCPSSSSLTGIQSDLDRQLKEQQWEVLCQMMGDKTAFVFGKQGCLTDTELHTTLKVSLL